MVQVKVNLINLGRTWLIKQNINEVARNIYIKQPGALYGNMHFNII